MASRRGKRGRYDGKQGGKREPEMRRGGNFIDRRNPEYIDRHPADQEVGGRAANLYDDDNFEIRFPRPHQDRPPHPLPAPVPASVQPKTEIHRKEAFFREQLHLGQRCYQNQCLINREFDPFCLCHMESRQRIVYQIEQRRPGVPAGLRNLGNTCYMNSYLQTLFHTLPVRRTLYAWRKPPLENRDPSKKYDMVTELRNLFARMQSTQDSSVSPLAFVRAAGINNDIQQDAQEFQILFLDWLDQVVADRPKEEKLQSVFKGRMRSTIRCRSCNGESTGETDFHSFTLPTKDLNDIMSSLTLFFADEQIDGYTCQNCGRGRVADKTIKPVALPRFLNLHLLRYFYDRAAQAQKKLSHPVKFPHVLDLRPFLPEEKIGEFGVDGCKYRLMAILIHVGNAYGGHYFARIRVATDDRWYTFDDAWVTPYTFGDSDTDTRNAYLLVYEKQRDAERAMPVLPQLVDIPDHGLGGCWQVPDLRKEYGCGMKSVENFLNRLKVQPDSKIIWLPSNWLTEVVRAVRGDDVKSIPAPNMSGHLCLHGRLANLRGMKAVSATGIEHVFDILTVVPIPFFVDGAMFCAECASSPAAFDKNNGDESFGM